MDGDFGRHLQRALVLLDGKGLPRGTSAPLLYRLLWKLGFRVPPPPMAGFASTALLTGAFFGPVWGLAMWLMMWRRSQMPVGMVLLAMVLAGVLFGLAMGLHGRRNARRRGIPLWRDFQG
ncbi:DUF6404 family protein [Stenotrophomonas sp. PS02297]|uniref:DUF6404 family protein n=1 Tax=Stenotrophomonas sp. PS02297 TaxID=2991423 RepID=UPI00249A5975|nr:DUF6404 family protein [Stenotrophomonas sp. PS02297]